MQGQTLEYVIIDFRDGFIIFGSFYVAITRVRDSRTLFLRDFHPGYVKASKEVNDKIKQMQKEKPYKLFKKYLHEQCFSLDKNDFKIGYLNVNGLLHGLHCEYINNDKNLLNLHLLTLSETWLTNKDDGKILEESLSNWRILFRQDASDC